MLKLSLAILSVLFVSSHAAYNQLQWKMCHTATQKPAFTIYEMDLTPMVRRIFIAIAKFINDEILFF
jgi:hypothetical protein